MPDQILALDPALTAGWAHSSGARGVWDLRGPTNEHSGKRLWRFMERLREVQRTLGVTRLAFEEAAKGSNNPAVADLHHQLRAVLLMFAEEIGVPWSEHNPATLKKFATGNGRAKKWQMIAACERHFGFKPKDDNEADAVFVLKAEEQRLVERRTGAVAPVKVKRRAPRKVAERKLF